MMQHASNWQRQTIYLAIIMLTFVVAVASLVGIIQWIGVGVESTLIGLAVFFVIEIAGNVLAGRWLD